MLCLATKDTVERHVLALQIAVIESNPEQSKHLETARMKVAGLELDLVNLRSEKYADQSSRIPTMEFGTPEQDALRCSASTEQTLASIVCGSGITPGCMCNACA